MLRVKTMVILVIISRISPSFETDPTFSWRSDPVSFQGSDLDLLFFFLLMFGSRFESGQPQFGFARREGKLFHAILILTNNEGIRVLGAKLLFCMYVRHSLIHAQSLSHSFTQSVSQSIIHSVTDVVFLKSHLLHIYSFYHVVFL